MLSSIHKIQFYFCVSTTIRIPNMKNENHAKDLNRHLTIKDIQMTNKPMKRHSTSLIIREVQVKNIKIKMLK